MIEARIGAAAIAAETAAALVSPRRPRAGEYKPVVALLSAAHVEGRRFNFGAKRGGVWEDPVPLIWRGVGGA